MSERVHQRDCVRESVLERLCQRHWVTDIVSEIVCQRECVRKLFIEDSLASVKQSPSSIHSINGVISKQNIISPLTFAESINLSEFIGIIIV